MELQQFEQAILKLAFETEARITTASVAYYLGIPSREANSLLNQLLEEGVLELDSDGSGNLFYFVPNHPGEDGKFDALKDLHDERSSTEKMWAEPKGDTAAMWSTDSEPQGHAAPSSRPAPPNRPSKAYFLASADGSEQAEAFNPAASAAGRVDEPVGQVGPPQRPGGVVKRRPDTWGGFDDYYGGQSEPSGRDGVAGAKQPHRATKPTWGTVSTRVATTDASVGSCGSSNVIVSQAVRCEPKPLPASKPVITSCSEAIATTQQPGREHSWFGQPTESTALVPAGETALARDYYIEQPEHQPGMALLLSLILCGTGQIYNGEISKGIMMMVLCFLLWFVLLGWVVHIWSIVDAVVVAERLNRKSE